MRLRRLFLPTLVTLPVLAILIALGTWQLQRLHWKTDLLARIDAAEAAAPVPLTDPPQPFRKVVATGLLDHDREALLGLEVRGTTLGSHLIVPLLRDGEPPLLVDRGWVPLEHGALVSRPEGEVSVTGWVRPGEARHWLSATDDPAGRRFYTFDPAAIGSALGLSEVAPYGLVALGPAPATQRPAAQAGTGPRSLPEPAHGLPRPPNNHLGYVITWYGLALALVLVFGAWARRRLAETETPGEGTIT